MKKGTHIWFNGRVWTIDGGYKTWFDCSYNDVTLHVRVVQKSYFNLPINDPYYAKILWTP